MKNNTKLTNKTLKIILTLLLLVGQFSILTRNISADDDPTPINSWDELVAAAASGGSYILKSDIAAEGSINVSSDFKLIGDNKTISQKQRGSYDSLFKVANEGSLTLGTGLTLSGKVSQCGPGTAEAIEDDEDNIHTLRKFFHTESAGSKQASFTSGGRRLSNSSGNQISFVANESGHPNTVFTIDENGRLIYNNQYVVTYNTGNYQLNNNADNALVLCDSSGNPVSSVSGGDNVYVLKDTHTNIGGYIKLDGEYLVSKASLDEAIKFSATNLTPGSGSDSSYWLIPTATPIDDENNFTRFESDEEDAATAALNTLNKILDRRKFKHVPNAVLSVITNKYYYSAEQDKWVNSSGKTIDEAMEEYNASHPSCTLKCPNEVDAYNKDTFNGDIENYKPKGFFVHVEAGGKASLKGAILEDFITNRTKDKSPRYVAPVVANGENASFDVVNGTIQNNTVGYIVDDAKANESADKIKYYIKGATPNAIRAKGSERRNRQAEIDGNNPGSGITATAGAIIYAGGAQGEIKGGKIKLNRGDTGGIMATGEKTTVTLREGTDIDSNVGVQFGGGVTTEAGAKIKMYKGIIQNNVAWFGGGGVYATENGVQWLLGKVEKTQRKDGIFEMYDGTIDGNTAFTRGGGFFVDSDGVSILKGVIKNNMSRMIGGGMYVMGDHVDYTYTVFINTGYVHENKAVSAGPKNSVATDEDNQKLSRKLVEPKCCQVTTELFDGQMNVNSDDLTDGYPKEGSDGTGGGIWLCAYGSTVLNMEDDVFIIDKNYATGSSTQGSKAAQTINPNAKDSTSSDKAGGNDIHKETKANGSIVVYGIKDNDDSTVQWHDENTGEWYTDPAKADEKGSIADFSLRNLTNMGDHKPEGYTQGNYNGVDVYGNISRRGGGLAADGTFVFGNIAAMGDAYSELAVTKTWVGGVEPQNVTIKIYLEYEEDGQTKTLDVIELPLSNVIGENDSELDTAFTDGSKEVDGKTVYLGHIILPITVEDENGKQIQLFDLLDDKGNTFAMNKATGLLALGEYLEGNGKVTLSNAKRKLKFVELIDDGTGTLVEAEGFELTPSEMKLSTNPAPTFHKEKIEILQEDGTYVDKGTIITSDVRFEAALYNDKPAEIEKYVNKAVHKDIELDEEFEYDIIAYVKHGTDKLIIEDKLVEDLEFVSEVSDVVSDVKVAYLDDDNHLPKNDIEGKLVNDNADVGKDGTPVANKKVEIKDNKLTVTIENTLDKVKDAKGNVIGYKNVADGQNLTALWGKWVKVTYKARVKKTLQDMIKNGEKSISDLQSITIKDSDTYKADNSIYGVDELRPTPNVGNDPVKTDEDHTGIVNTASYILEVKNNPEFRDESNTVTVKPTGDYKKIDVEKIWDDSNNSAKKRPSSIKVVLYKDGDKYKEAILNEDNSWKYSFTGLPEDGEYKVEEEKVEYYLTNIEGDSKQGFKIKNIYREYFPDREFEVDQCGEYILTKNGSNNISKDKEFTFKVNMIIDKGLETEKKYQETIKLKIGESKVFDYVVEGTQITVEEINADDYNVTYYLDDKSVTKPMTIIKKKVTTDLEVFNSNKEKPPIPKTGIE